MKRLIERIVALSLSVCICLSLCAAPTGAVDTEAMPEEGTYGPIELSLKLTQGSSANEYVAEYTATTIMIDWLAQAAAVCKDDPRMANLRFTCTLTDMLTATLSGITSDDYVFTSAKYDGNDIFILDTPDAVAVINGSIVLRYKLNPDVLSAWHTAETAVVKENLQQKMCMTARKSISASILPENGGTIVTTGRIDITTTDPEIPFYDETLIFAAYGECSVNLPNRFVVVVPDEPKVAVIDKTPSQVVSETEETTEETTKTGARVGGGTTTVENPNAMPGEDVKIKTVSDEGSMVNHIVVRDENGNRIPVTYDGKGNYSFEMPEDGEVTIEAYYRVIPADPEETGVASLLETHEHIIFMIGDDKGDFRPNASISRAEVATAFFRLLLNQDVPITQHFTDVSEDSWYVQPVETLASLSILQGLGNGSFEPNRAITRAEFAAVAARFANQIVVGESFADVDEDAWYASFVSTAASFGWINGVGNDLYEPDRPITRTEAAAIINRMLRRISDWVEVDSGAGRRFQDVDDDFWGIYEITEATSGHDHTLEEDYYYETWEAEDWREAVDNDPVNFGQPMF